MPAPGDLCSLDDVTAVHRTLGDSVAHYDLIHELITDASAAISRWTGRRFAPPDAVASERTFCPHDPYRPIVRIADLAAPPVAVSIADTGVVAVGGYTLLPEYRLDYEPITAIRILERATPIYEVTVEGRWGFPAVPPDVRRACVATVNEWLTHAQAGEGPPPEASADVREPQALPGQARWLLRPYRRTIQAASIPVRAAV